MRILRCEVCECPCTLNMLEDKPPAFCPVTGEKVQWVLVNKKWTQRRVAEQSEQTVRM